ncbi:DUF998 domain-containing protein [Streptomyces sp. NBC_01198]|uniref:DUF998 domain-containing protein n=1 Tax=Streptomyces sp. NBC_01198 TaxID=2903769 RepID=UPI002E0D3A8D|nr:DUF998 domain-containing protein [Streptomyces sp. NBC_01198]
MGYVTWWAVVSSGAAPVLLVGGSTTAAVLEGPSYNPVRQTISVLAAGGPTVYWVFTAMVVALGVCHLATATGLRAARLAGRLALGAGGLCAIILAFVPAPKSGGSFSHGSVVTVGFTLLALWPVLAADRRPLVPWGLRLKPSIAATSLMALCAAWFLVEDQMRGVAGVAERTVTILQALWPVVVVISCLRYARRA